MAASLIQQVQVMSIAPIEGHASLIVSSRFSGGSALKVANPPQQVRISHTGAGKVVRLDHEAFLKAPNRANYVEVMLQDGLYLEGVIGTQQTLSKGGWMLIDVEVQHRGDDVDPLCLGPQSS